VIPFSREGGKVAYLNEQVVATVPGTHVHSSFLYEINFQNPQLIVRRNPPFLSLHDEENFPTWGKKFA